MPIVVSDTSALLNLGRIGRLDLLSALYDYIVIPPAVEQELRELQSKLPISFANLPWLQARRATCSGSKRSGSLSIPENQKR